MINVLIVEDSPSIREFLTFVLGSDPGIRIAGTAADGEEAVRAAARLRPDVITMDIHMPKLDGVEATQQIMETVPTPIVIVSDSADGAATFRALEAGAVAALPRPAGLGHQHNEASRRELIDMIKAMAEVRVVRRWPAMRGVPPLEPALPRLQDGFSVVALGASTGGPPVLQTILSALPRSFPLPILIVQHMALGFVESFAEWLNQSCNLDVRVASNGEAVVPGAVYVAPDGVHMKISRSRQIALAAEEPRHGLQPAVGCLFRSLVDVYGSSAIAGLLTGMGRDGAAELKELREAGAMTFAQDRGSSIVFGMPGEAIRLDAACRVLPVDEIAPLLISLARESGKTC